MTSATHPQSQSRDCVTPAGEESSETGESANESAWYTVCRPGYFGSRRAERWAEFDEAFGPGNWRLAWLVGDPPVAQPAAVMFMLYEDAYAEFLIANPAVLDELCATAREVYDDAPSNVASGLDYTIQETDRTHVQDIALRRAVLRVGRRFEGNSLLQIRDTLGDDPLSVVLSPGQVPFHRPSFLVLPELTGWWAPGSVESFYQSNKVLQARVPSDSPPVADGLEHRG